MTDKKVFYKVCFTTIALFAVGVVCVISASFMNESEVWIKILNSFGVIFIVSCTWTLINKFVVQRNLFRLFEEKINEISSKLDINSRAGQLGVKGVYDSVSAFDFTTWIKDAKNLNIVSHDCSHWVLKYKILLCNRVKLSKPTKFFIPDLESDDIPAFCKNTGCDSILFSRPLKTHTGQQIQRILLKTFIY